MLTLEKAIELNGTMVTEEHLLLHAKNVCFAMGAVAAHFGEDVEHWQAVGMLHDYDYEKYPEEHLQHTEEPLREAGVEEEDIRAILSHGYGICTEVKPETGVWAETECPFIRGWITGQSGESSRRDWLSD